MALTEHRITFLSLSMKSLTEEIENSSKNISSMAEFCVLATKLGTKENVQDNQPLERLMLYDRQCNLQTLWLRPGLKGSTS